MAEIIAVRTFGTELLMFLLFGLLLARVIGSSGPTIMLRVMINH